MSERFRDGLALEQAANKALDEAEDRQGALTLLLQAKEAMTECQEIYRRLVQRAGQLIVERQMDGSDNGFDFQDHLNHLSHKCYDGAKIERLEHMYTCLLADMRLDDVGALLSKAMYQDVLNIMDATTVAYTDAQDAARLHKTSEMRRLVMLLASFGSCLQAKDYDEAAGQLRSIRNTIHEVKALPPRTIQVPCLKDIEEEGGEGLVLRRALAAGDADQKQAQALLQKHRFDDAARLCVDARRSFQWAAQNGGGTGWESKLLQLECEINRQRDLAAGDQLLAKARTELSHRAYDAALTMLNESMTHYSNARADDRIAQVPLPKPQMLIPDWHVSLLIT